MTAPMERPLAGRVIGVTRAKAQAGPLVERLGSLGADVVELAMIEIVEPSDGGAALASALTRTDRWTWIVVASPNGARALIHHCPERPPAAIACVGPGTAAVLLAAGWAVDLVPDRRVAEGLVDAFDSPGPEGGKVLILQAEIGRNVLAQGLRALGWQVERVAAYRTVDAQLTESAVTRFGRTDVVAFTSSSTVERFLRRVGADRLPPSIVSIGPVTSRTIRDAGLTVAAEADPHDLDGLVDALCRWAAAPGRHGAPDPGQP